VTDDMIEAVMRAFYPELMLSIDDPACQQAMREAAQDAIRAVAPMILDMAADVVDDAEYAGFVRQLKERFQ
jgi:hypothetical protein